MKPAVPTHRSPGPWRGAAAVGTLLAVAGAALGEKPREMGLLPQPGGNLLGFEDPNGVIDLPATGELVVRKVRPTDCRDTLAFAHAPIDGRIDSWGYNGVVNEYNDSQGYRVAGWQNPSYEHMQRPGVHVTLAERETFNCLYVRGGFRGDVFTGVDAVDGPGNGSLLTRIDHATGAPPPIGDSATTTYTHHQFARVALPAAVAASRISFFRDAGLLSDVSFLSVGDAPRETYIRSRTFAVGQPVADVASLGLDFRQLPAPAPPDLAHPSNFDRRFFRASDRTVHRLGDTSESHAIPLAAGQQLHLVSDTVPERTPISAVRLDLGVAGASPGNLVNLAVQDPLSGSQELLRIDVRTGSDGRIRALLDFPDVLMPEGGRLWLTVASRDAATLTADSTLTALETDPAKASEEHLAWRLLMLKGYFSVLSEQRPWKKGVNLDYVLNYDGKDWRSFQRYRPQLLDLYRTVEHLHKLYPDHPIASRQYYDFLTRFDRPPIDPGAVPDLPATPSVPRWAFLLNHASQQLVEIPRWWIEHRMAPNGELGGYYSDDTDMVQWWTPSALIDSEDFRPLAENVFTLIADGVQRYNLRDGVNIHSTDPLHAYEEGQNHMAIMPLLFYGNPHYVEELMRAAASVEKWMLPTPEGHLRFNARNVGYFGWDLTQDPLTENVGTDFDNTALLLHSHLMLAWYNGHAKALDTLKRFADTQDGGVEGSYGGGPSVSFGVYWLTGDPKYLALDKPSKSGTPEGWTWTRDLPSFPIHGRAAAEREPWWGHYLRNNHNRPNALGWALSHDRNVLERALEQALYGNPATGSGGADRYRYMWTEAEQFTDRVFIPVEDIAQAMLGGFTVRNKIWPSYAVSYEGLGRDFAGLVLEQGKDRLKVALVNLRDEPRTGAFRVWQLDHGMYEMTTGIDIDDDGDIDRDATRRTVELARMDAVPIELPPKRVVVYQFRQMKKLDDLLARPDLALTSADLDETPEGLKVTVHNIGSREALSVAVSLVDAGGAVLRSATIDRIDAPLDYRPRTTAVTLPLTPEAASVVIDPEHRLPEITRINNTADLPR